MDLAGRRVLLALVFTAKLGRTIESFSRGSESQVRDLADLHAVVKSDRQRGNVAQLKSEMTLPAGVHITCG